MKFLLNNKWLIHMCILSFWNIWLECSEFLKKLDILFPKTLLTATELRGMSETYEYVKKWAMLKSDDLVWNGEGRNAAIILQ